MPRNQMKPVYDSLLENGQTHGIGHFGTFVVNTFRIEKGFKMWGSEMNCDGSILEAGLGAFVRMKKKSDFLGKQAVKDQSAHFISQRLTMLEIENDGKVDPDGNHSVWLCGRVSYYNFQFCSSVILLNAILAKTRSATSLLFFSLILFPSRLSAM